MTEPLEITVKILTPLWTGGVDGTADRIHETGLIGSLRWWYEAIVRGLGGKACDPAADDKCRYDPKESRLPEKQLCPACYVFGATGWRRRFRLEVVDANTTSAWNTPPNVLNIRPPDRNRGWYLPPGRMGRFTLRITGEKRVLNLMAALLLFLERRGSLGAKPQLGYGVFAVDDDDRAKLKERVNRWQWEVMGSRPPDGDTPDLRRFGFFCYQFQPEKPGWWTQVPGMERVAVQAKPVVSTHKTVPLTPTLKNAWRFRRWQGSRNDEREIFGSLRPDRIRSKIAVSWAYEKHNDGGWEVRGSVWLQNAKIARDVWDIVRNEQIWQQVIGLQGHLETSPAGAWHERSAEEVVHLLEEAK